MWVIMKKNLFNITSIWKAGSVYLSIYFLCVKLIPVLRDVHVKLELRIYKVILTNVFKIDIKIYINKILI